MSELQANLATIGVKAPSEARIIEILREQNWNKENALHLILDSNPGQQPR